MVKITISEEIAKKCPDLHVLAISCDMVNTPSDPELWKEIAQVEDQVKKNFRLEEVNKWLPIKATRQAYKSLGKDPNRYRPSAEALYRRILRGLTLYKIDTLVDIVNLISIKTGYSIGAFDVDKISGENITLGIGREGEKYEGIGRGCLNISGLPVYRDALGGIGTPTSDEERTKIELSTTKLLMIVNGYSGFEGLNEAGILTENLLKRYVSASNLKMCTISFSNQI